MRLLSVQHRADATTHHLHPSTEPSSPLSCVVELPLPTALKAPFSFSIEFMAAPTRARQAGKAREFCRLAADAK